MTCLVTHEFFESAIVPSASPHDRISAVHPGIGTISECEYTLFVLAQYAGAAMKVHVVPMHMAAVPDASNFSWQLGVATGSVAVPRQERDVKQARKVSVHPAGQISRPLKPV